MIHAKPHRGATAKLSDDDCEKLQQLLSQGATSYGWLNNLWTAARVGRIIYDHFGVTYHPAHIFQDTSRAIGRWTCQRPVNCPGPRDDKTIDTWATCESFGVSFGFFEKPRCLCS